MLLLLTGSSCSGKSTAASACGQLEQLAIHDSDEHGVPSDADAAWRQQDLERWVQQAIDYERDQVDLLLTGQSPLGELLATPSAPRLQAAAVCLLDVRDRERWWRLEGRDPGAWSRDEVRSFISWAHWHRGHAADPQYRPEVITSGSWPEMHWDRWAGWTAADPRWQTSTIDTTGRDIHDTAMDLRHWVDTTRRGRHRDALPITHGWDQQT